jgi:hypothetical protein
MSEEKPVSPWKLTPGRIAILVMGVLLILYTISALMGGLTNYQALKQGATEQAPAASDARP